MVGLAPIGPAAVGLALGDDCGRQLGRRRPTWCALLRRRWETGSFLTMFASGQPWSRWAYRLRGPAPGELATRFGDAQAWVRAVGSMHRRLVRVEHKRVGGRVIGANSIPCRAWIDSYRSSGRCSASSRTCRVHHG